MTAYDDDLQSVQISPDTFIDPEDNPTGPGCLVWGIVALLTIGLALVVVAAATVLGFQSGVQAGKTNAASTRVAAVATQCSFIATELSENRLNLIELRFEELEQATPAADCVAQYAPTATQLALQNQPTMTPTLVATVTTDANIVVATAATAPSTEPTTAPSNDSPYDLDTLFDEGLVDMSSGEYLRAADTFEAIAAVDANYRAGEVEANILNALTLHARQLYNSGDPADLPEAMLVTDRAEAYGDIGELNYERYIAGLYVDAQRHVDLNYGEAIRLLNEIVIVNGLSNYLGGKANSLLFDQHVGLGDALAIGEDYCSAVNQYQNALQLSTSSEVIAKLNTNRQSCDQQQQGLLVGTPDPNATLGPTSPPPGVAPVGQQ